MLFRSIQQLTPLTYQGPHSLAGQAVLVVGSGQSGCQIAYDCLCAGKQVHLSISRTGTLPARYRGCHITHWLTQLGIYEQRLADLPRPELANAPYPHVAAVTATACQTLPWYASQGMHLYGRLMQCDQTQLQFLPDCEDTLAFHRHYMRIVCEQVNPIAAGHPMENVVARALTEDIISGNPTHLDLADANIDTVIWCTGFNASYPWIDLPIFDAEGHLEHQQGMTAVPGCYVVGLPCWQRKAKSALLYGIAEDVTAIIPLLTS